MQTRADRIEADDVKAKRSAIRPLINEAPTEPVKTVHFPDVATALRRRREQRENLAARILLFLFVVGALVAVLTRNHMWWIGAGFVFVGFVVVCYIAGANRDDYENSAALRDWEDGE